MNDDGSSPKWLTKDGNGGFRAIFSNDGQIVYFPFSCPSGNITRGRYYDIYSINIDGSDRRKLINLEDFNIRSLSLSPYGKFLMLGRQTFKTRPSLDASIWIYSFEKPANFISLKPDVSGYYSSNAKNKQRHPLDYNKFFYPEYSPDGKSILFVWSGHYQGFFGHEIYMMDIKTLKTHKITNLKEFICEPSFSHDGKKIAFTVGANYQNASPTHFDLYTINSDGSNLKKINFHNHE